VCDSETYGLHVQSFLGYTDLVGDILVHDSVVPHSRVLIHSFIEFEDTSIFQSSLSRNINLVNFLLLLFKFLFSR
jgi:hypothetical protein